MPNQLLTINNNIPLICNAVRTVGIVKPTFDPVKKGFKPPSLQVFGTGFWMKGSKTFITCAHVVDDLLGAPIELAGMLVVGGNGIDYKKATIYAIDYFHDLAILNIEADKNCIEQQSQMGLEIVNRDLSVGETIAYAGFPLGNQLLNSKHSPTYVEGVIGSEVIENMNGDKKQIQISGSIVGGFSGAPLVLKNDRHKLIGVVSNSPSKEAGDASIFMGIHWRHIKAFVDLATS